MVATPETLHHRAGLRPGLFRCLKGFTAAGKCPKITGKQQASQCKDCLTPCALPFATSCSPRCCSPATFCSRVGGVLLVEPDFGRPSSGSLQLSPCLHAMFYILGTVLTCTGQSQAGYVFSAMAKAGFPISLCDSSRY